ncbi:hypothetical protein [Pantoea agglomerans]
MDNSDVALVVAGITVSGVILSGFVNFFINHTNRTKSYHEWKREKLLLLSSEFIEAFHQDARSAHGDSGSFDPSLIEEMAISYFYTSEQRLYRLCMLLESREADNLISLFDAMKKAVAKRVSSNFYHDNQGDFEERFYNKDETHVIEYIKFISNIINEMK